MTSTTSNISYPIAFRESVCVCVWGGDYIDCLLIARWLYIQLSEGSELAISAIAFNLEHQEVYVRVAAGHPSPVISGGI